MPTLNERESWERALREQPDKARLFGPPAWLVEERRKSLKDDPHILASEIREELGLGPPGVEGRRNE
jgi:hypothetical protein